MSPPEPMQGRTATAGFTLLELLVVIGTVSVLLGLSVGFLGKTDSRRIAGSILAGEMRAAQMTARAEGVPTEVWVRPGVDGQAGTVQARLLQPAASFHFEPDERALDESLRPQLTGRDVPNGRFGHARRNVDGERSILLRWPLKPALVDISAGFVVRADLWLERRTAAVVLRFGKAVELLLDDELRPHARLRLRSAEGTSALASVRELPALPLRRWCTLELTFDGQSAWIGLDGRELGRTVADGRLLQEDDTALELSPGDSPIPGLADELRVLVFAFAPPQTLPADLQPSRVYRIGFDTRGETGDQPPVEFVSTEELP